MKNILKNIVLIAALAGACASCNKVFDQSSPSTMETETVYSHYTLAEEAIFSIHTAFTTTNSYRGRFLPWYGFNTDIEVYNSPKSGDQKTQLVGYDPQITDTQMNSNGAPFADMYTGIEKCNLAIEGLEQYGSIESDPDMAYLYAEALTLRAMLYYDLVKAWGDVPARFAPISSETLYQPKESRDVIFEQILGDLETAIPMLPYPKAKETSMGTLDEASSVSASYDRVNKAFAEGLYARIALTASGYALRPADGQVGTGDLGSVRLSSDSNLSKDVLYPKALAYLKDVISSGTASLVDDYQELWYDVNNMDKTAGKEVLFCIPFGGDQDPTSNVRGRWNYTFAIKAQTTTINGYLLNNSGGTAGPNPTFWYKFDEGDVRRDLTCANWHYEKEAPTLNSAKTAYFGKFRFDWMDAHPYTGGNDDGVKPVVMRYADILLMASEISNELGDLSSAKQYFLPVRRRAFKGNESLAESFVNGISSKDDMFAAIYNERAFEFCGEFLRKADLIRWNMLGEALEAAKEDIVDFSNMEGDYAYLKDRKIYWKANEDGDGIDVYGLLESESGRPEGNGWTEETSYIKATNFEDLSNNYYLKDPDTRQFWPIFNYILTNSQGYIVNDYGY